MTKLHNYNGRYCETEYENAFLSFLEEAGWNYLPGSSLPRTSMRDVLYIDDMEYFLNKTNPDLTADEIQQIMDKMSDDDLLSTVRSRHIQAPSEIIAWSKELSAYAEHLESQAQELIDAENAKQEAEEAAAASAESASSE